MILNQTSRAKSDKYVQNYCRSPDQVTPSRNVPARRKRYPETNNSTLVPRRHPPSARNQTYQVEGASCDPSCVTASIQVIILQI